jgi:hypothetical protein
MRLCGVVLLIGVACFTAGCGSKAKGRQGHGETSQPARPAPPTPDTTPIEALRTPAGLALKLNETPAAVTPPPSPSPAAGSSESGS